MEDKVNIATDVDGEFDIPMKEVEKESIQSTVGHKEQLKKNSEVYTGELVSCLRNERIIVRYLPKLTGIWGNNPKHVLAGGMAEGASKVFVVPKLSSGVYVNILTDSEKVFLENIMGLEYNALSVYKKVDNYWSDANYNAINKVRLTKQDNYLDLSNPDDYIRYKILLANKDFIAPSLKEVQDYPKATYQFVIISEGEETKVAKSNMSAKMMCYKEFGKIEDNIDILRTIIETLEGRPTSPKSKIEFLQTKINDLIQADSKMFLKAITDPMLSTKVLIKKSIEAGIIANRGNFLYLKSDNSPLCEGGEEPTINIAAKYLNSPKHQEIKFMLEAKLKQ